jgi:hypothetical protein
MVKTVSARFYSSVYRKLYQKYSLAAGDAYRAEMGNRIPLDQFIQYYNAFETYPRRAINYLNGARNFEVTVIPEAEPSYDLEEGILFKDTALTTRALNTLDPVWERELISKCYREFARNAGARNSGARNRKAARQNAAEELFALTRGALLQAGISLPTEVRINFTGDGHAGKERTLRRALEKAGFTQAGSSRTGSEARYRLDVTIHVAASGFAASFTLVDADGVVTPLHRTLPLRSLSRKDIYGFAGALSGFVFRVE